MFCAYCGKDIGDNDMFCSSCGKPTAYYRSTHASTATAQQRQNGEYQQSDYTHLQTEPMYEYDQLTEELVGVKAEYYMPKFMDMQYSSKKLSWNWCAFLVPVYWLLYRKMYMYAAVYFILSFILAFMGGLGFVLQILLGMFGNFLYMKNIESLAAAAKNLEETEKQKFIAKKGGVSKLAVIAWMAFGVVVGLLIGTFVYTVFIYG